MTEITHQDCQDLVEIWNELNDQLVHQANRGEIPIQERINENHRKRVDAFRMWLTHHAGKTING